jgi:hypothetical protein
MGCSRETQRLEKKGQPDGLIKKMRRLEYVFL